MMKPKMFGGKESKQEEMAEANAVKKGKISPKQYAAGEAKEGHGKGAMAKGMAIKSGRMSPSEYAKGETNERKPKMYLLIQFFKDMLQAVLFAVGLVLLVVGLVTVSIN